MSTKKRLKLDEKGVHDHVKSFVEFEWDQFDSSKNSCTNFTLWRSSIHQT